MTTEPKLPGFPKRSEETLTRREAITTAVCALHRAMLPVLEVMDHKASISMKFKVAGDDVVVSIKPGKPNDEELR